MTARPVRLLVLNPNTTEAVTKRLVAAGRAVAAPGTVLVPLTAPRGVPYISTRAEALFGGAVALEMLAEHAPGADGAILAAFGDPGLGGARELFDLPVVGLAEASMLLALTLGRRFSIVTFAGALGPWYEECVAMHGLQGRCASVRALPGAPASLEGAAEEREERLVALALAAVEEDGAEVLILAGAPLAGLAARVRERLPVPVIDQMAAAVKVLEGVVALDPRKATRGSYRRPDPKPTRGLPAALAARIEGRDP